MQGRGGNCVQGFKMKLEREFQEVNLWKQAPRGLQKFPLRPYTPGLSGIFTLFSFSNIYLMVMTTSKIKLKKTVNIRPSRHSMPEI